MPRSTAMSSPAPGYLAGDQAARRRALDPASSFLVQAPAGSGKTELLIQRFLALLALVEAPEAVVAITFTRKAAGEMQDRILGDAGPRRSRPNAGKAARDRLPLARPARARTGPPPRVGPADHPARLRIQTIDSLLRGITRQMPWLARLGAPARDCRRRRASLRGSRPPHARPGGRGRAVARGPGTRAPAPGQQCAASGGADRHMLRFRDQWLPLAARRRRAPRRSRARHGERRFKDGLPAPRRCSPSDAREALLPLAPLRRREPGRAATRWRACAALNGLAAPRHADQHRLDRDRRTCS